VEKETTKREENLDAVPNEPHKRCENPLVRKEGKKNTKDITYSNSTENREFR